MPKHYWWQKPLLTEDEKQKRHREASKQYAQEHAEWNRERVKKWRDENADKLKTEEARARRREYTRRYREKNPDKIKAYSKKHYEEKGQERYKETRNGRRLPGGHCELCGKEEVAVARQESGEKRALQQDHCHASGVLRGLLCLDCNRGLGAFKDNPELLRAAAAYIEKYRPLPVEETNHAQAETGRKSPEVTEGS